MTDEERALKKAAIAAKRSEYMKAYQAKKKAAKEAQAALEAQSQAYASQDPATAPIPVSVVPEPVASISAEPLVIVKPKLPATFKDMPSHLVEKYQNLNH